MSIDITKLLVSAPTGISLGEPVIDQENKKVEYVITGVIPGTYTIPVSYNGGTVINVSVIVS